MKSGLFRFLSAEAQDAAVTARVADYALQAGVYVLAAERSLGVGAVKSFTFFFSDLGRAHRITVTKALRARWAAAIATHLRAIRHGQPSTPAPPYAASRCERCDLTAICRPTGMPDPVAAVRARAA